MGQNRPFLGLERASYMKHRSTVRCSPAEQVFWPLVLHSKDSTLAVLVIWVSIRNSSLNPSCLFLITVHHSIETICSRFWSNSQSRIIAFKKVSYQTRFAFEQEPMNDRTVTESAKWHFQPIFGPTWQTRQV